MEAKARQKNIGMPARKLRRVMNEVRGKSVLEAMKILKFMPYFAAKVVEKNLTAAVANAAQKWGVGCIRVTHPCAGRHRECCHPHAAPRLACVKPVASVHPEPGSNSSLYIFLFL